MKKSLLFTFLAVLTLHVTATAQVDQWTFTDATTPQNSDIKNIAINFWDPGLTGNSHDSATGVLTWGHFPPEGLYKSSSGAYQGIDVGVAGAEQLVLIINTKDIHFSGNGAYRWQFTESVSSGNVYARISYFNDNVTMRIEGLGSEFNGGVLYTQSDYTSITDLQLTFTWDFANQQMLLDASGSGVLAAGGTGTISFSESVNAPELTGLSTVNAFRTAGQGPSGSYMELDNVAIHTTATLSTPNAVLNNAKVWYTKDSNTLHIDGVTANSVRVYALSGAKVAQYDNPGNTIALGDLSSGLYIASVLSEHGTKAVKFVK